MKLCNKSGELLDPDAVGELKVEHTCKLDLQTLTATENSVPATKIVKSVFAPIMRDMHLEDLTTGFHNVLSQLRMYSIKPADAQRIFKERQFRGVCTIVLMQPQHDGTELCIGTASMVFVKKFYGQCGFLVGVVVDKAYRNKAYGLALVNYLIKIASSKGCYKVILNCDPELEGFYRKLQFQTTYSGMKLILAL